MDELTNKKILIADDETELLKMIADSLYREGFFCLWYNEINANGPEN